MKRIIYLTLILPIFLFSCEKVPEAHFYVDQVEPEVGDEVVFTNSSHNAVRFEWDFGDGITSNAVDPVHIYTGSGSYQVTLTAISKSDLSDKAYQTIDVMIPTLLEVEVVEYYDEYPVENASVIVYPTLSDWDAESNMITEGYTDAIGKVVFSGLGKYVYYLDVWEAHHNNYILRKEDVGFIRTNEIIPHEINRFVAYVDYVSSGKGNNKRDRTLVIKSIGRKITDKN
jgi:PKD repeat protein